MVTIQASFNFIPWQKTVPKWGIKRINIHTPTRTFTWHYFLQFPLESESFGSFPSPSYHADVLYLTPVQNTHLYYKISFNPL